jgi:hypothetical protein
MTRDALAAKTPDGVLKKTEIADAAASSRVFLVKIKSPIGDLISGSFPCPRFRGR